VIDDLVKLKDYVPLFSTFFWILFIGVILIIFKKKLEVLITILLERVKSGSSFKAGPIEIGEQLEKLEYADPNKSESISNTEAGKREEIRSNIYKKNKGLFLTHIITPSKRRNQKYDIFIYLIRHDSIDFSDIKKADFFFGHMWSNQIFSEVVKNGIIGISTSAYGPFLCTCCVVFKDGSEINLERYIDFEMEKLLQAGTRHPTTD
jgi:hypothetical protein